jgi:hypothetical protein
MSAPQQISEYVRIFRNAACDVLEVWTGTEYRTVSLVSLLEAFEDVLKNANRLERP